MKRYEFLEHTADVKFLAYGKNLEEAFANAALATYAVMTDVEKIESKILKKISIESKTKESLLYDFIEKLLYLLDTEGFLLSKVKKLKITGKYRLEAELAGDKSSEKYDVHSYVKAPTYNDMKITEGNKITIQMVLDI